MDDSKVRYGRPEDVDGVMELAKLCTEENGLLKPSTLKILGEVWGSLNFDHGVMGVIDGNEPGQLAAAILMRIDTMPYSEEQVICERAIFVHPDFRNAKRSSGAVGNAALLCEFAKGVSESLDMPLLIGVLSSQRAQAKVRLYERHFGEPSGAYWLWNGKTGAQSAAAE